MRRGSCTLAGSQGEQLPLFDFGGIDLSAIRAARDRLAGLPSGAPLTVRGYASDWLLFDRWCVVAGKHSLPATIDTVGLYISWLLEVKHRRTTTAERHLSAIIHYHRTASLDAPVSPAVRQILKAARRERKEKPRGKTALAPQDLVRLSQVCDPLTNRGARDRAIIILGFATSLRRSNLSRLELSDITFRQPGLVVNLRSSKTDQDGVGRSFGVWAGERVLTDPVSVVRNWIEARGDWAGPLFTKVSVRGDRVLRSGITGETVNEIFQRALAKAGINPAGYGSHSLRAGAITASAELGRSDQEIKALSGHANVKVMQGYIRPTRVFAGRNPLAGVL